MFNKYKDYHIKSGVSVIMKGTDFMKNKNNILFIIVSLVLVFSLAACGQKTEEVVNNENMDKPTPTAENTLEPDNTASTPTESEPAADSTKEETNMETKIFTLEELSAYNGTNGMPAYVAVDGIVYDFTNLGAWRNGKHNGYTAGKDLTDEIINVSPHGLKNLEGVPIVGSLAKE